MCAHGNESVSVLIGHGQEGHSEISKFTHRYVVTVPFARLWYCCSQSMVSYQEGCYTRKYCLMFLADATSVRYELLINDPATAWREPTPKTNDIWSLVPDDTALFWRPLDFQLVVSQQRTSTRAHTHHVASTKRSQSTLCRATQYK